MASNTEKVDTAGDSVPSREKLMEKYKQALTIAQKAKNARDEAIKENKVIITENENLRGKVKTLEKQYGTAEEMLAALTEQKLKLAMEIDDLKKQKALFIQELKCRENSEVEVETFKRQYNRLLKENEELIKKFGSTETESVQLRKELNALKQDNDNLRQQYSGIQSEKESLDRSFKETLERLSAMEQNQRMLDSVLSKKFNKVVHDINEWSEIVPSLVFQPPNNKDQLSEIQSLKTDKEKCSHFISSLSKEKEILEQEVFDLNKRLKITKVELDIANSDRDKMVSNLEKVGLETKQLIENSEKLTDEIEILKQDKTKQDQTISFLQNEKQDLTRTIKENEIELNRMSVEFNECRRFNEELTNKIELLENSNYSNDLMSSSIENNKSIDSVHLTSDEKPMKKEGSVNSELNQLQEELQVFSCEIVKYKQIADDNEQKYMITFKELSEKQEELKLKDIYLEECQEKITLFEEQKEILSNNISECKLQLLSALEDLSHAEEINNKLKDQSDSKEKKLISILEELRDKDAIIFEKLEEINHLKEELKEKNNILDKVQTNSSEKQTEMESLTQETTDLKSYVNKIVEENKSKFNEYENEIAALKEEVDKYKLCNENLTADNSKLTKQFKDHLNEQASENNNLVQKLTCLQDSLQSQLSEKQTVISDLDQEILSLKTEISSLNEQNLGVLSDNKELKNKLDSQHSRYSNEIAKLEEKFSNQQFVITNNERRLMDLNNELVKTKDELGRKNEHFNNLVLSSTQKLLDIKNNMQNDVGRLRNDNQAISPIDILELDSVSDIFFNLIEELKEIQVILQEEIDDILKSDETLLNGECTVKSYLQAIRSERAQLSDLRTKFEDSVKKLDAQTNVIKELEKEKIKLNEATEELSLSKFSLKEDFDKLTNDYCILKRTYGELEMKIEELSSIRNVEHEQHDLLVKNLKQTIEDMKKKEIELADSEGNSITEQSDTDSLRKRNIVLNEENSSLKSQVIEHEKLIHERDLYINEIKVLSEKNKELISLNDSLSQNISAFEDQIEKMKICHLDEKNQATECLTKAEEELKNCNEMLKFKTMELKENNRIWAGRFSSLKIALIGLNKNRKEIRNHLESIENLFTSFMRQIKEPLQEKVNMVIQDSLSSAKHELITEMQQMNQALKERGESISKLEFSVTEHQNNLKKLTVSNENLNRDLEQSRTELKQLVKNIQEKDSLIKQLEEENEQLKESHDNTADTDMLSTSTISRTEEHSRLKDVEDSFEDRYTKLKILAVKMKKRIGELTQTLETERSKMSSERNELLEKISGMSMAVKNAQKLQELFDQSLDEQDDLKKRNKIMENSLEELKNSEETMKNKIISLESSNQSIPVMKKHIDSLNAVIKESKSDISKLQMENKAESIKYEELKKANLKLEGKLQELTSSLEQAKQQGKNSNVLELEIKNYEKIISDLTSQINTEKNLVKSLQAENEAALSGQAALEDQITILEKQMKVEEERNQHTNEQLNSTRQKLDELSSHIEGLHKEMEDLQKDHTSEKNKNEALTLEMSRLTSDFSKKEISMTSRIGTLQEQIRSLETSLLSTKQELTTSKHEIDHLHEEYESYKLRAQTILAKRKGEFVTHGEKEAKEEVDRLKKDCKLLEEKIEAYISEIDTLNTRLSSLSLEKTRSDKKHEEMKQALQHKIADFDLLNTEYYNYKIRNETTLENLKDEMLKKKNEYQSEISHKQKLIDDLTAEFKIQEESLQQSKDKNENHGYFSGFQENIPLPLEREDGEGSESVPSPKTRRRSSIIPLDILLNNPIVDENKVSVLQEQTEKLRRELTSYEVRCRHLSSLLSEAEKDSARNLHQNKILKEELRRLERSLERQPHVANTEYLKNIVFKFVTLPHGDERTRLVPVLDTLLKLSPEETHKLNSVAKGESPAGWSSYLQSWTGL